LHRAETSKIGKLEALNSVLETQNEKSQADHQWTKKWLKRGAAVSGFVVLLSGIFHYCQSRRIKYYKLRSTDISDQVQ
jgi:hypothetical protein